MNISPTEDENSVLLGTVILMNNYPSEKQVCYFYYVHCIMC